MNVPAWAPLFKVLPQLASCFWTCRLPVQLQNDPEKSSRSIWSPGIIHLVMQPALLKIRFWFWLQGPFVMGPSCEPCLLGSPFHLHTCGHMDPAWHRGEASPGGRWFLHAQTKQEVGSGNSVPQTLPFCAAQPQDTDPYHSEQSPLNLFSLQPIYCCPNSFVITELESNLVLYRDHLLLVQKSVLLNSMRDYHY
jgi:hypothetical protein